MLQSPAVIAAVVLINAERLRIPETAEALVELDEVSEVYSVAGEYDLVAIVRVREYDQMAEVVPRKMARVPGIVKTTTLMAFQCYSRRDLERMWGIGLDEESVLGESPRAG
ncbi:MAG TPA: Lrp/AsnC ligand binding domain-containing protein [Chloroflexota bacterium]|nr:Lrp/AsnC ligand binding domain-containing protein [Chloroflexota bacterium]